MNPPARRLPRILAAGLVLTALLLGLAFLLAGLNSRRAPHPPPPVYGQIDDFTLTNQSGAPVSLGDLRGRSWVADIIFTRCAGPCLRMSRQMKELQDALPPGSRVKLISLTTDPEFDGPAVLAKYAVRFGADTNRWMFLTGSKEVVGHLAAGGLRLSAVETKPVDRASADDLFIHSTMFVAVDKRGRVRGVFETGGEGVDWQTEKRTILATLDRLEREP